MSQKQQAMPAAREAQRVMAITPLFWEKVVLGGPPARAEKNTPMSARPLPSIVHFPCNFGVREASHQAGQEAVHPVGKQAAPGCGSRHLGPRWAGR